MGVKRQEIGAAAYKDVAADIRLDIAQQQAKAWMARVGLTMPNAELEKIRQVMEKAKKPMTFEATLDDATKWLGVEARVGGKLVAEVTSQDLSEGGDQRKWRQRLEKLTTAGTLFSAADLKAFDQKHPDPDKVDALRREIGETKKAITVKGVDLKRRAEELKKLQEALKADQEKLRKLEEALKKLGG